ncbi:AlpA family phage regulatory protein [Litorivicinus sp.]|nr:AlpA family phage regulatory protein [Litorivicinus sp.]
MNKPKRYLRLSQILEILPIGRSTWWKGVKDGRFPPPIKLGTRITMWDEEEVLRLVQGGGRNG